MDPIERFLRMALLQRRVEDARIRDALQRLRPVLADVERIIRESGALEAGPARERIIRAVSDVVARRLRDEWGVPLLASLQSELVPFVEQQMTQARLLVEGAGGTIVNPGAAAARLDVPAVVNGVIVNGRPLADQLTGGLPVSIADRAERFIRLGLNDPGVAATFETAVARTAENAVEVTIRSAVHSVGSEAQQAIYQFETDPEWTKGEYTWTAVLDSRTCPVCIGQDGTERREGEPGAFWDGRSKIDPHPNCRCYVIPKAWRGEANERVVKDDKGERRIPFRVDVEDWIRANPETAAAIFGRGRAERIISGELSLERAIREAS